MVYPQSNNAYHEGMSPLHRLEPYDDRNAVAYDFTTKQRAGK